MRDIAIGDRLPDHVQGPISRGTLALYAGASNDDVLFHIDSDYAKACGMDDVIAHGMLSMAYLAQMLAHWGGQENLRDWKVRFLAVTPLYATVRCTGEVIDLFEAEGERRARLKIGASVDGGPPTIAGEAVVALNQKERGGS